MSRSIILSWSLPPCGFLWLPGAPRPPAPGLPCIESGALSGPGPWPLSPGKRGRPPLRIWMWLPPHGPTSNHPIPRASPGCVAGMSGQPHIPAFWGHAHTCIFNPYGFRQAFTSSVSAPGPQGWDNHLFPQIRKLESRGARD